MKKIDIKTIDVHQLKAKIESQPDLCLIDVRELEEWQTVHIPGAKHIPKDLISSTIASLSLTQKHPIFLHCRSGVRSLHAAQSLVDLGYEEVFSVEGGIVEWAMYGYPIQE